MLQQKWRIGVSIPVPRRCKRRTLPIELIPHETAMLEAMVSWGSIPKPAGGTQSRYRPNVSGRSYDWTWQPSEPTKRLAPPAGFEPATPRFEV